MDGNTSQRRLRIGLLLDSDVQPLWVCRIIEQICASDFAEVALVIKNASVSTASSSSSGQKKKTNVAQKLRGHRGHLLYALYTKLDDHFMSASPDAFERRSVAHLLDHCAQLSITPHAEKYTDTFADEDVEAIRACDLDVALRFGFRILKGRVLDIARHGVWSYHHGDALVNRGSPPGFWEVMRDQPVTGSVLQVLTEELDNGKIICRSWSPTTNRFSVRKNNNHFYWKSAPFVMRRLRALNDHGALSLDGNHSRETYTPYSKHLHRRPTESEMLRLFSRLTGRAARRLAEKAFSYEQWEVAYRFRTHEADANNTFYKFKHLVPPKDRYWADPFPVQAGGRFYIFVEEFVHAEKKGHIAVIEVSRKGQQPAPAVKVLERPYHLSYPLVFEWQGERYMIPETGANGTVELYRSHDFPTRWELEKVLLEGLSNPVDATLCESGGKWWMFLAIQPEGASVNWEELHLYCADTPLGAWTPHRDNPVKSDVRNSRPAGRLFEWHGELHRPAQDCSRRYGYGISINKIVSLSPEEFREEEVSKILPEWERDLIGVHTLNSAGDLTVIDCLRRRRRLFG